MAAKPRDLERLQGVWAISTLETDGQAMPAAALSGAAIAIEGDRFTVTGMAEYGGTLTIDERARPRRLDLRFSRGPEKGNVNPCIYELKDDTLTLCISTRTGKRPARFASPAGSGFALETLVRGAAAEEDRGAARKTHGAGAKSAAARASRDGAKTEIEGEWKMLSGILGRVTLDAQSIQWVRRTNAGRRTRVTAGPQVMLDAEFTLDPTASPKTIDYRHTAGANRGKAQRGIYELEGDRLTILMGAPEGPRPAKFAVAPPRGGTLTSWERA